MRSRPTRTLRFALAFLLAMFAPACGGESVATDSGGTAGAGAGGAGGFAGTGATAATGGAGGTGTSGSAGMGAPTLAVDSVNLQLEGAFGPFPTERLAKAPSLIAALSSDVLCVQEARGPRTRSEILNATSSAFPHRAVFDFDLDTVPQDPTNQQGVVPPSPSSPPCSVSLGPFFELVSCIQNACVVPAKDPLGTPVDDFSACLTAHCVSSALPLLGGNDEDKACWSCAFVQLSSWASPDELRVRCAEDPRARFAWNGDTGTFVLSRHPIENSEAWVLPSTEFRVILARAEVTPSEGEPVDVYCTSLTQPAAGLARPYTGYYGNGAPSDEAWGEELYLQAERLVKIVNQSVAERGRSGVLVGTLYAGPQGDDDLQPVHQQAFDIVSAAFPLAVPTSFLPSCTFCGDNPLLSPPDSTINHDRSWQSFVFLVGSPAWTPRESSVILKENVVGVATPAGKSYMAPVSTHYGFRTTFLSLK